MAADPNLDGDFVALYDVRKEKLQRKTATPTKVQAFLPVILQRSKKSSEDPSTSSGRPDNNDDEDDQPGTSNSSRYSELRKQLFNAARTNSVSRMEEALAAVSRAGGRLHAGADGLRDPENNMNVLLCALLEDCTATAEYLLGALDELTLVQDYKVKVKGIGSNKTALHVITEGGNLALMRRLLGRLPPGKEKSAYIKKEVLTELSGQRPRHLSCIHLAALHGHTDIVQYLVDDQGVDPNTLNNKDDTPVLWAARGNHIETVRKFIQYGAKLQHQNDKGSTPLYWAVRYGFPELLKVLIVEGKADVNQQRKLGFIAPIVLGAALGYADIVETLVQHGAPITTRITGGMTALHHAAAEGNVDVIETLLRYHANVNDADDMANTPLLLAARGKHLEAMKVLIEHGANTDCKNKLGQNIWDFVVDSEDRIFMESGLHLYRREKQLEANGRITFEGAKGPMHVATAREDVLLLNALIALGVDCKSTDQNGNTFYHQAARDNSIAVLRELLEKADVNAQNIDGDTALLMACKNGSSDAVAFLLPKSNLEKKNRSGETALHVAARSELASVELVQKLVDNIVKASNWSLLDEPDKRGNTALHAAIRADRVDIIRALHNLNPRATNDMMECPLHIAAASGTANLLEEILDVFNDPSKGLNIDQRDGHGQTALHICALRGDSLRVELLVERGADLTAKDTEGPDSGNTVLHALALKNGSDAMFATNGLIEVINSILFKATVWWCMRNDRACPDVNSELYNDYTREAVFYLTTKVYNAMKMNVLCYAAKVGAIDLLNHLLNADGVFRSTTNRFLTYDITGLTPETMPADDEVYTSRTKLNHSASSNSAKVLPLGFDNSEKKALVSTSPDLSEDAEEDDHKPASLMSLLDVVVDLEDEVIATRILNLMPLKKLVENYWSIYRWIFFFLMVVHIGYMSVFSYYSLDSLNGFNVTAGNNGTEPNKLYGWFLSLPAILVFSQVYYIFAKIITHCRRKSSCRCHIEGGCMAIPRIIIDSVAPYLISIIAFIFSAFVAAWYWAYIVRDPSQPFLLAVALIFGWMFTIVYTKGFETMHSFSIMITYIILKDILRFLLLYVFVLLAFGLATHALFQIVPELSNTYPNAASTLFVQFNVMLGLSGYIDTTTDGDYQTVNSTAAPTKVVYIIYVILCNVILMSLLVAMMTDTYGDIKRKEGSTWRVGSVRQALTIGWLMPCMRRCLTTLNFGRKAVYFEGKTLRWNLTVDAREVMVKRDADGDVAESLRDIDIKLNSLTKQVELLLAAQMAQTAAATAAAAAGGGGEGAVTTAVVKNAQLRRKTTKQLF